MPWSLDGAVDLYRSGKISLEPVLLDHGPAFRSVGALLFLRLEIILAALFVDIKFAGRFGRRHLLAVAILIIVVLAHFKSPWESRVRRQTAPGLLQIAGTPIQPVFFDLFCKITG